MTKKKAEKRKLETYNNRETDIDSADAYNADRSNGDRSGKVPEEPASLPYSTMFERYIRPRMPVKFQGLLKDTEWKGESWNDTYLREKAGDAEVRVEIRDGSRFGKGLEKT